VLSGLGTSKPEVRPGVMLFILCSGRRLRNDSWRPKTIADATGRRTMHTDTGSIYLVGGSMPDSKCRDCGKPTEGMPYCNAECETLYRDTMARFGNPVSESRVFPVYPASSVNSASKAR